MSSSAWSKEEVKQLKKAFKAVHQENPDISKGEKWRMVSDRLGGERTKRECYDKYKELLELRAKEKESKRRADEEEDDEDADHSSSRHHHRLQSGSSTGARKGLKARAHSDSLSSTEAEPAPSRHEPPPQHQPVRTAAPHVVRRRASSDEPDEDCVPSHAEHKGSSSSHSSAAARGSDSRGRWGGSQAKRSQHHHEEMTVEDCEDFDVDDANDDDRPARQPAPRPRSSSGGGGQRAPASGGSARGTPISADMAAGLRGLLFGDETARFNHAWLQQEFVFSRYTDLGFGLMQHKGGPCGVLAVVQAFLLAHLLHRSTDGSSSGWQNPRDSQRKASLAWALSTIIWQAGKGSRAGAVVALASEGGVGSPGVKSDGVTERVQVYSFDDYEALHDFIRGRLDRFMLRGGGGVVMATYSVMLSRGVEQIRQDMDDAFGGGRAGTLIDRHGYATQELVNLLLVGRAHSNVFDGERLLDDTSGKSEDVVRLRGIPCRGTVGFLTLFEAYKYFEVGGNLKEPELPVWVVCSESHYSVLFLPGGVPASAVTENACHPTFSLQYFDGLANQQEPIVLTINRRPAKPPPAGPDDDRLIPPMDLVIRTRWPGASVEWSGEPIL